MEQGGGSTYTPETDTVEVELGPTGSVGHTHEGHPIADITVKRNQGNIMVAVITRCLIPEYCYMCVMLRCRRNPNR